MKAVCLFLSPEELKALRVIAVKGLVAFTNGFIGSDDQVYELARAGAVLLKIEEELSKTISQPEEGAGQ